MNAQYINKISWRPAEVAMVTGLSLRVIESAIASKELASCRVGRARVIRDRDLHAWLDAHFNEANMPEAAARS